jgi:hypothetical protein
MPKHTPEPWKKYDATAGSHICRKDHGADNEIIAYVKVSFHPLGPATQVANADRIVACVNGCKGIPDPEKTIPALLAAVALAANQASILAARETDPEERARYRDDEAHYRALTANLP